MLARIWLLVIGSALFTTTLAASEKAEVHEPLCTNARYWVVADRFSAVSVEVVLLIFVITAWKASVDDCHRSTFPVLPCSRRVVELTPGATVPAPEMLPPTVAGCTV